MSKKKFKTVMFVKNCEVSVAEELELLDTDEYRSYDIGDKVKFRVIGHPRSFDGKEFVDNPNFVNVEFEDAMYGLCIGTDWFTEVEE